MFKVKANIWSNDGYDYIDGEYSGIVHKTREEAEKELARARKESGYEIDLYIEET